MASTGLGQMMVWARRTVPHENQDANPWEPVDESSVITLPACRRAIGARPARRADLGSWLRSDQSHQTEHATGPESLNESWCRYIHRPSCEGPQMGEVPV